MADILRRFASLTPLSGWFSASRFATRRRRPGLAMPLNRLNRNGFGSLALCLLLAACGSDSESEWTALPEAPLQVEPKRLQLPPIPFGQRTAAQYRIQNRGSEPLHLTRIGPAGCTCAGLRLELPQRPQGQQQVRIDPNGINVQLQPKEQAILHLELNTGRYREPVSRKIGSIPIYVEGYAALLLEWGVDIWVPYWAEPWSVNLGVVGSRQRPVGRVTVNAHDDQKFELLVPEEIDGWELSQSYLGDGEQDMYEIRVTAPEELPLGPFYQEFRIPSDLPEAPPVKFTVQGIAEADLAYAPKRLMLAGSGETATASFILWQRNLALEFPAPKVEWQGLGDLPLHWEMESLEPNRRYRITVTRKGPAPTQSTSLPLKILTNDPESPEILIPVLVLPQKSGPS
ncbi:MAG: hypothetical protein DWQ01_08180 [Planctomycetota bacterium]|nr:MAG: hypothetical protein DWQ01_08180 [Planctomycetota bacterium]